MSEVPPSVVTSTSTAPGAWPGVVNVRLVPSAAMASGAMTTPAMVTTASGPNPVPVTVTDVPPATGPASGTERDGSG